MDRHEVDRRAFLRNSGLLAAGALTLTGCGTPVVSGLVGTELDPDTLTYWSLLGGGDGQRMVNMVDNYRKQNPDEDVKYVTLSWGNPFYTKVSLATLGGKPPDVAISHLTRAEILAKADLLDPYEPADLERFGFTADKFTAAAWEAAHVDGKLYAIPLDIHPYVLFYNTDVCKKAGLLDKDGNLKSMDGPDALPEAMAAAQKVTGQWGGVTAVIGDTSNTWRWFWTLYRQSGGEVIADDGTEVTLDVDLATKILTYQAGFTIDTKVMPAKAAGGAAVTGMATGKTGFFLNGEWELSTFLGAETPFSMTRFPQVFGDEYAVQADSHTFVMPKNPDRSPERLDRMLTFIKGILDQSPYWAEGGHVPTWLPTRESAAYQKMKPQSNYASSADSAAYDPPAWYSGSGSNFEYLLGGKIGAVLSGELEPARAADQMRSGLQRLADTESPIQ